MLTTVLAQYSDQAQVISHLNDWLESVIDCHHRSDAQRFFSLCAEPLTDRISEAQFVATCQQLQPELGKLTEYQLLTILRQQGGYRVLWQCRFSATDDDVLVSLSTAELAPLQLTDIAIQ